MGWFLLMNNNVIDQISFQLPTKDCNLFSPKMESEDIISKVQKQEIVFSSKWLGIKHITYENKGKVMPNYEATFRTTRKKQHGSIDGVGIYTIIQYKQRPSQLLLIANFRPPTGQFIMEFPAGLMDSADLQENARREVLQQTGYVVDRFLKHPMPLTYVDPWKSDECGFGLIAIIDGDDPKSLKKQDLQGGQNIRVYRFTLDKNLIQNLGQFAIKNKFGVQQKVWAVASMLLLVDLLKT